MVSHWPGARGVCGRLFAGRVGVVVSAGCSLVAWASLCRLDAYWSGGGRCVGGMIKGREGVVG